MSGSGGLRRLVIGVVTGAVLAGACVGAEEQTPTRTSRRPRVPCDAPSEVEPPAPDGAPITGPLRVDASGRFVLTAEGEPFFWLGDTAWAMIRRAATGAVEHYLRERHEELFNVVQILVALDTTRERYWSKVDHVVDEAASLGMYVAIVPCWHCFEDTPGCWDCLGHVQEIDDARIRAYGGFLGSRYGSRNVVWLLGGDAGQDGLSPAAHARYTLLAESIASAAGGPDEAFIGVQPRGADSSSSFFHDDPWLDFDTLQSGHVLDTPNYKLIARDYAMTPVKPTHEGESIYEDIPELFWESVDNPRATAWDARKGAYWGVFGGGFGHTYGANGVWSWTLETEIPDNCCNIRYPWYEALRFEGASQMQHLRRLVESRPFLDRIPDQSIVVSDHGSGGARVQATRGADGSYAFVYISDGHAIRVDMTSIACGDARGWWYDPRTGAATAIGTFANDGARTFTPPTSGPGNDWVLVLDDVTREFGPPGRSIGSG